MQTKRQSLYEAFFGTAIGFVVAWLCNWKLWPLFGFQPSASAALWVTVFFTVISVVRVYLVRRLFVWVHLRQTRRGTSDAQF